MDTSISFTWKGMPVLCRCPTIHLSPLMSTMLSGGGYQRAVRGAFGVTNKKSNSFTNPPQFAYPCIIAAPYQGALNPRLAFILGRIALILQNPLFFTSFFRNFATKVAKLLRLGKKRNKFLLFFARLFVTLPSKWRSYFNSA